MGGGVSHISERFRQANNEYLKSYFPKQESKHIIYLDSNDLYGYAMSNFLLTGKFKWIDPKDFYLNKSWFWPGSWFWISKRIPIITQCSSFGSR